MRKIPVSVLSAIALLFLTVPGGAQTASLAADINPGFSTTLWSSEPKQFLTIGNKVFFSAGSSSGEELWITDGTASGTRMLGDLCPGSCSSSPVLLATVGKVLFFSTRSNTWLWRTDGTQSGTFPIKASGQPLTIGQISDQRSVHKGVFYFQGCTPEWGCEPWRSDGTLAGTRMLADLQRGDFGSDPRELIAYGDRVLFFANVDAIYPALYAARETGEVQRLKQFPFAARVRSLTRAEGKAFFFNGKDLWISDGTGAGTQRVQTFKTRIGDWIKTFGGRAYFLAQHVTGGPEIWRSDGTASGTRRVTDLPDFMADSITPQALEEVGDRLVFLTHVNPGGLVQLRAWTVPASTGADPVPPTQLCGDRCPTAAALSRLGGQVLLLANAGEGENPPGELWSTDGTAAGTRKVRSLCDPGSGCAGGSRFLPVGGEFAFTTWDGTLWKTDGTAEGTRRVTDRPVSIYIDDDDRVAAAGERLLFAASDGDYGHELWVADGRPGGTRVLNNLGPEARSSAPEHLVAFRDQLLFLAGQEDRRALWRVAGGATEAVQDVARYYQSAQLVLVGDQVFWWNEVVESEVFLRPQLWVSDGTPQGTRGLTLAPSSFGPGGEVPLHPFKDRVYFIQPGDVFPNPRTLNQVWSSDGTLAGTGKAFDFPAEGGEPFAIHAKAPSLFIESFHQDQIQIWKTDGTAAGLHKVFGKEVHGISYGFLGPDLIVFTKDPIDSRVDFWKLKDSGAIRVRRFQWVPKDVVEHQGAIYFLNGNGIGDFGLWRSDGTDQGTFLVRKLSTGGDDNAASAALNAAVYQGKLYFTLDDGTHGTELWRTDGTTDGTVLLKDIFAGPFGSSPSELRVAGGRLFFSASDGIHGFEVWQSDGTAEGTRMVQDIASGGESSYPGDFTPLGDHLYFRANDGISGSELWSLPLAGTADCQLSATALCLNGGRYKVEIFWRNFEGRAGRGYAAPLSSDTGYFWFFDDDNVETVVKVLDGQGVNGHVWVYYGALTNIEYTLAVTDTRTGLTRHYFNPLRQFGSAGDSFAFGPLGAKKETFQAPPSPPPGIRSQTGDASGTCQPSSTRLCLRENRFAVEVAWTDFSGGSGPGHSVGLTGDTGYFWFFNDANVELILKVLDAQLVNGKFWVFYGALSDVGYTIIVTDTVTGRSKTYENPKGSFASFGDTDAF